MKPLLFGLLACATAANAATTILTDNALTDIPDGSSSGVARVLEIDGMGGTISLLEVSLQIAASPGDTAFLGDLYVYLSNGTDIAILLNRPGRTATAPSGYADDQSLNVTFTNSAAADIHNYRLTTSGSATTPLSGPLTGIWLADGRSTDPANVLDTDLPDSRLDAFNGGSANQQWTLFVADLSGGAQHRLMSWTLSVETVPEPSSLLLTLGALPLLFRRRR